MKRNERGFTLIELLVVIAIIALLMGLLLPALAKALDSARTTRDQAQLRGVCTAFSIHANQHDDKYPVPGQINRLAAEIDEGYNGVYLGAGDGEQIQGVGDKDYSINTSANLHSYMIGNDSYSPEGLISANETNGIVAAKGDEGANPDEVAYNYEAIDVANDSYWDPIFSCDIGMGSTVCHSSFANMALCGKRIDDWKDGDSNTVVMASRGPEIRTAADINSEKYSNSPTLQLYGATDVWEGIFVVADGSAHYATDFFCDNKEYISKGEFTIFKDNCYQADFADYDNDDALGNLGGASGDNWVVLNINSTKTDVEQVYDEEHP